MKRSIKTRAAALISAALLAVTMTCTAAFSASAATTSRVPNGLKLVTTTGNLSVTLPENITTDIKVSAYEMLQLVVPTASSQPATMTNTALSENLYLPTDNWVDFFATAKAAFNVTTPTDDVISTVDTLYLKYDTTNNRLELTKTLPAGVANKDYITIDNAPFEKSGDNIVHVGRLEKGDYFAADLVSRIADSPAASTETTASAARLLSDWASSYVKANRLAADKEDSTAEGTPQKQYLLEDLVYGYYVVIASEINKTDGDMSAINQSILNVPGASNVSLKATPITVDKYVDNLIDANKKNNIDAPATAEASALKNSDSTRLDSEGSTKYEKITANVGDVLTYKIESHIPALTSYDLVANSTKLLPQNTELTETNFAELISGKYVYIIKDIMQNQNFVPANTTISGVDVKGLKMEVKDSSGTVVFTGGIYPKATEYYVISEGDRQSTNDSNVADYSIGRLWETDYNTTTKTNFFAVNFDLTKLKEKALDGKDVVFTYQAELMGEALHSNANDAKITYSNDPFDANSNDTIGQTTNVYTYDIKTKKVFSDGSTDQYANVKFKLYSHEDLAANHEIAFTFNSEGQYTRSDSNDTTTTTELAISTTDGTLLLKGLGEGTYYLKEQDNAALTNAGFNIANVITVTISAKNGTTILDETNFDLFNNDVKVSSAQRDGVTLEVTKNGTDEYAILFNVLNQKGFHLPLTGEYGNWLLAIGGILLVAIGGTVIILINRKKGGVMPA